MSTDHKVLEDVGYEFVLSDTVLGHGAYGKVYLATDENNKQVAIKCSDLNKRGIPNILECSIMSTIVHPYLNKAHRILASDNTLYIIQDQAKCDLADYTRRTRNHSKPSLETLRQWCFCIAQAVEALHKNNIIHADIKASNVLLYGDGSVRLTDYNLSTKKWKPDEKFTHNVCTCTHRPIECLLKKSWDESLDIWSLGCTFYEIAYSELLFPYQAVLEPDAKNKDRECKERTRNRSVNAILDWGKRGPIPPSNYVSSLNGYPIDYIAFKLPKSFHNSEMKTFNDLILKMLVVDPQQRITIKEVVDHPFFRGLKRPPYLSIQRPINEITISEQARAHRYIQRHTPNETIQTLALNLYCRCNGITNLSEGLKAAGCTWIASKIISGTPPDIKLPPHQILAAERDICHNLKFRLHTM